MSISTEIDRIISAVGAAYDAVEAKGGASPQSKTIENLAEAVNNIPSGSDITLGLTGAAVGQAAVVKAVDADGKPTQWEAKTLPEEVFTVNFTRVENGEEYSLTSDKTPEEVLNAISAKKQIVAFLDDEQLCNFSYDGISGLYFYNILEHGRVYGTRWAIEEDMETGRTYTLGFFAPGTFILAPITLGEYQIFGTGELGGYEFKRHIEFMNLPEVAASDNGKFMRVKNGEWTAEAISDANGGSF